MKKIFIAIHYMELGGAERALLGLLESLAKQPCHVDLFVYSHQGDLMGAIPEGIHLLPEHPSYAYLERPLKETLKAGHLGLALARLWARVSNRIHNSRLKGDSYSIFDEIGRATVHVLPSLQNLGNYDLAISFLTPHYIVRDKVRATTKVAWIHTDYSAIAVNPRRELPIWSSFDHIVSISPDVTNSFVKIFPSLADKIILQENLLPTNLIRQQAEAFDARPEMPGKIRLLSIGRFCYPKNFPGAVHIMAELCRLRDDVIWYLIGFGGDEEEIRCSIDKLGMQEHFIILGKRNNPYPYIKACDLYVQPSRYEGNSVTVCEAQFLGKAVAVTNYPTATSQIHQGYDGIIIPMEPQAAAKALNALLNDPEQVRQLGQHAQQNFQQEAPKALLSLLH
jgi:glycosyltransferase involved in cell wall biosynthesis